METRKAVKHWVVKYPKRTPGWDDININSIEFYVDFTEPKEIIQIIKENNPRFINIIREIFKDSPRKQYYKPIKNCNNVTEMIFPGKPNPRIICKEIKANSTPLKIIMCKGLSNKGTTTKSTQDIFKHTEKHKFEFYQNIQEYERTSKR